VKSPFESFGQGQHMNPTTITKGRRRTMRYEPKNLQLAFSIDQSMGNESYAKAIPTGLFNVIRTGRKLDWVRKLIPNAVLLPIKAGKKGPTLSGWNRMTLKRTKQDWYQERLERSPNLGVLLGQSSYGLCSIDLDSDEDAELFLDANPKLRKSLITKSRRGLNVWVNVIDDWPKLKKFDWGEWRADGAQTVISGIHPEGMAYRFVNEAPPIEVLFSDIVFPFDQKPKVEKVLHNIGFSIEPAGGEEAVHPIHRLYHKFVEPHLEPKPHSRNTNLIDSLSFLFYNVSPEIAFELGMMIYDEHSAVWNDSRKRHEYECSHFLKSIGKGYADRLPPKAQAIYATLIEQERIAFRICHSLARLSAKLNFFLSVRELQSRMGLAAPMTASRLLKKLEQKRVIKEIQKGSMAGSQASSYRWLVQGKIKEKEQVQKDAA
jgi:hypothetical protein